MEDTKAYQIEEDLRQSDAYGGYMTSIGWKVIKTPKSKIQIFVKRLGPVAIVKLQRVESKKVNWEEVNESLDNERVMMFKYEPSLLEPESIPAEFRPTKWPLLGTKTLRVNLRPSEEEILLSFKKDARYEIRKVEGQKVKVKNGDFELFYKIWKMSAKRKDLWIPGVNEYHQLLENFKGNTICLTAGNEAGALILINRKTAFYYYAGGTKEGTRMNLPYLIVWSGMKEAKRRGCAIWDFEGIYDHRWPNKGWEGFSHFKKSFGGAEIEFPGSWELWRLPIGNKEIFRLKK